MAECLRTTAGARPRSSLARLLGVSPLDEQARPWYVGALGEQEVGCHLARLGARWRVLHAVAVGERGSDIDHVVIGPGGVFTLNTKHHSGKRVWVASQTLMVDGQRQPYVRNAAHEAGRAAKLLSAAVGGPVAVGGAIVLVDPARLTVREAHPEVAVLTATGLVRWLTAMPERLAPEQVQQIAAAVSRPSTWQRRPGPRTTDEPSQRGSPHCTDRSSVHAGRASCGGSEQSPRSPSGWCWADRRPWETAGDALVGVTTR